MTVNDMTRRLDVVAFADTPAVKLPNGAPPCSARSTPGCILLAADAYGGSRRCLDMAVLLRAAPASSSARPSAPSRR